MKYLVIGAGGVGGPVAGYLYSAGKDVEVVLHGAAFEAAVKNGFVFRSSQAGCVIPAGRIFSPVSFAGRPDVIIICVKSYSLESTLDIVKKAAGPGTLILPLLNGIGIGDRIEGMLPGLHVLRDCIYVSAHIDVPGVVIQDTKLMKIVFGKKSGAAGGMLEAAARDFKDSGIDALLSEDMGRDSFRKYGTISPMAVSCAYFDCSAAGIDKDAGRRKFFTDATRELIALGEARDTAGADCSAT